MSDLIISDQTRQQMQQRSITRELVELVFHYSDIEFDVGGGSIAVRLSKTAHIRLLKELSPQIADRAHGIVLILRGDLLVTAMHAYGEPSRFYRRRRRPCRGA